MTLRVSVSNQKNDIGDMHQKTRWLNEEEKLENLKRNFAASSKITNFVKASDGSTYVCGYIGSNPEKAYYKIWKTMHTPSQSYRDANYITEEIDKSSAEEAMAAIEKTVNNNIETAYLDTAIAKLQKMQKNVIADINKNVRSSVEQITKQVTDNVQQHVTKTLEEASSSIQDAAKKQISSMKKKALSYNKVPDKKIVKKNKKK
jgi:hypothetical protein